MDVIKDLLPWMNTLIIPLVVYIVNLDKRILVLETRLSSKLDSLIAKGQTNG